VVDDAEMLSDGLVSPVLERVLVSGRDGEHGVILAGPVTDLGRCYAGFIYTALKSRCGLFAGLEGPGDGDLFGLRLPRGTGPGPLGRGLLVRSGTTAPVQIALPELTRVGYSALCVKKRRVRKRLRPGRSRSPRR
jgi:DNA segregation ATPase FtsK/SpoIIIE, S-DNA-T family